MEIVVVIIAALVFVGLGALILRLCARKRKIPRTFTVVVLILAGALPVGLYALFETKVVYHADSTALDAMQGTADVEVKKTDNGWLFDGKGTDTALVFYPGAMVDARAYSPLLSELAAGGVDCFLVEMPFDVALLGIDRADALIGEYSYKYWYIAGHSLGGIAAANYCSAHSDKIDGLILLASYSVKEISGADVLLICGSEDKVLDIDDYTNDKKNLPDSAEELIISGGNHSQFGSYGEQKGDGQAQITPQQQRSQTVDAIVQFVGKRAQTAA